MQFRDPNWAKRQRKRFRKQQVAEESRSRSRAEAEVKPLGPLLGFVASRIFRTNAELDEVLQSAAGPGTAYFVEQARLRKAQDKKLPGDPYE